MSLTAAKKAFTLIEIMIVVLIIGILLAIAVPNFIRARETARAKSCVANLRQIDSAKEQWAMDNRISTGTAGPSLTSLSGAGSTSTYIKTEPTCQSGGTYTVNAIATDPTCSYGTTAGTGNLAHSL